MYRRKIHEDDKKFQQVFWRQDGVVRTFQLNTVTFGVSAAPFLAVRTLQQLADDEALQYPLIHQIIKRDFYVDNLLTGAKSLSEILEIRKMMIEILQKGGFNLRQWSSNHPYFLDSIEDKTVDLDCAFEEREVFKTLGLVWDSKNDNFIYSVQPIDIVSKITKRKILSEIAKIFDPLGLLAPVTLYAKGIMQKCWQGKLQWDESVPQELHSTWVNFASQLSLIHNLMLDRHVLISNSCQIELHGFCDASQNGYGACLYMRSVDSKGCILVRLLCAKDRVKPLKEITIPQLELCGALVLARLMKDIYITLRDNVKFTKITCWSDSTIVLHWLRKSPQVLKVFERNRVAEIQSIEESLNFNLEWRHVRTHDNPADALSRGQLPLEFIKNVTWFNGPSWLSQSEKCWPHSTEILPSDPPELRKKICLTLNSKSSNLEFLSRFSSYRTLINVVAYCLRLIAANRYKHPMINLCTQERVEAERKVIFLIQQDKFSNEIKQLLCQTEGKSSTSSRKKTRFDELKPFVDEYQVLRVGGRLKHSDLTYGSRHPILLPSNHFITDLIIRKIHFELYHAGVQTTLYHIRTKFWIPNGKDQVRKVIRECVICFRHRPDELHAQMADLPKSRVNEAPAFIRVGVDYFGPLFIKEKKWRNKNKLKVYGCVFVCMVTKAVHIEIVSDLTTDGFLAALRRFVSCKGIPSHIYSDNGTNFVGASNHFSELFVLLNSDECQNKVRNYTSSKGISWHFNPPQSPHFGGLWEAAVKSFKHYFRRVIGDHLLTFEELSTLANEIEAILNSRPLCAISADPNDPISLTPAHLLIGRILTTLPDYDYSDISDNRLSTWNFISKARQDFWKRWHVEYLNELQLRQKWKNPQEKISVNSVVILREPNQPCCRWPLGVIIETHPGGDGVIRVVTVKTANGIFKRNITNICLLLVK